MSRIAPSNKCRAVCMRDSLQKKLKNGSTLEPFLCICRHCIFGNKARGPRGTIGFASWNCRGVWEVPTPVCSKLMGRSFPSLPIAARWEGKTCRCWWFNDGFWSPNAGTDLSPLLNRVPKNTIWIIILLLFTFYQLLAIHDNGLIQLYNNLIQLYNCSSFFGRKFSCFSSPVFFSKHFGASYRTVVHCA